MEQVDKESTSIMATEALDAARDAQTLPSPDALSLKHEKLGMATTAADADASEGTEFAAASLPDSTPRKSIFTLAASLASQAGRVITLPRTKSKPLSTEAQTDTESSASSSKEPPQQEQQDDDGPVEARGSDSTELLLPWQIRDESTMEIIDDHEIRNKILALTVFRATYVDHPGGEEEYLFDFAKYKPVATELLLCDPSLREMHHALVPSAVAEASFWRNFFLRCNFVCVDLGRPPYLREAKSTYSTVAAVASFQKFKRDMYLRRQRSAERLRRNFQLRPRSTGSNSSGSSGGGPLDSSKMMDDVDLGELDLDLDGEIDKELLKRRPSRAAEQYLSITSAIHSSSSSAATGA